MNKLFTPGGPYPSWDRDWGDAICEPFNLETAVGSQKSAQALGAPGKIKKCRITTEVTTNFFLSLCTPISSTFVLRPTAVSRFKTSMYVAAQVLSPEGGFLPGMLWLQK